MGLQIVKKSDFFDACFGAVAPRAPRALVPAPEPTPQTHVIDVTQLPSASGASAPAYRSAWYDGEKFPGGYGVTDLFAVDYWTLRARSAQLYQTNLYARGLIRRMVTNEINVGLHLEATPEEAVLGYPQDGLAAWGENVENRFSLWASDPRLCDHKERLTFGELQQVARREALVVGDVLCVLRQDQRTKLPRVQLIPGTAVQTPLRYMTGVGPNGNQIVHGVEIDKHGRHVAYHVAQGDFGESKRMPCYGEKSGRRIAWLIYGTDCRLDDVRGQPLLSIVLQSLREIDRYRDSVQRKAVINSLLAMFITKDADKPGTRPLAAGGISRATMDALDNKGEKRSFNVADYIPGVVLDELQTGEEPHGFMSHGTDEKFGDFERSIIQAVAWTQEIPPEILLQSFNSNYSASQAAVNEYKLYLNPVRTRFGNQFCRPIYNEWLLSEALDRRIDAPRFLEAWRDPKMYDIRAAWLHCDWAGQIKPAVDVSKLVKAYAELIVQGLITRDRAARELTGTKYSKNVQRLRIENEQLLDANRSLMELEQLKKPVGSEGGGDTGQRGPGRPKQKSEDDDIDREEIDEEDDDTQGKVLHVVAGA